MLEKLFIVVPMLLMLTYPSLTSAQEPAWYFPVDRPQERVTVNSFGQVHDNKFYEKNRPLFPYNTFSGYHVGTDFEAFENEITAPVPVYTATEGKILYIGTIEGYGGLIIQTIPKENKNMLYGHVKIANLPIKIGDFVTGGQQLTTLGDQFSHETSQERKHLHYGIYKGTDTYLKGYEQLAQTINQKWEDPMRYLTSKQAKVPDEQPISATVSPQSDAKTPVPTVGPTTTNNLLSRIFHRLVSWINIIFT